MAMTITCPERIWKTLRGTFPPPPPAEIKAQVIARRDFLRPPEVGQRPFGRFSPGGTRNQGRRRLRPRGGWLRAAPLSLRAARRSCAFPAGKLGLPFSLHHLVGMFSGFGAPDGSKDRSSWTGINPGFHRQNGSRSTCSMRVTRFAARSARPGRAARVRTPLRPHLSDTGALDRMTFRRSRSQTGTRDGRGDGASTRCSIPPPPSRWRNRRTNRC